LLRGALALMALDHVDAAHEHAAVVAAHLDHLAGTALVAAGDHHDAIALPDLRRHHSTSGASEMIFMWFFARSSRGTGPKMRVPTGSICGLISTAALRSKRMIEPSGRLMSLEMRTMTAFITSPFLTRPRGIASFTDTTMTSPMVAYLRLEPPSTLMHMTRRAPELSATSRLVCIWIMGRLRCSSLRSFPRKRKSRWTRSIAAYASGSPLLRGRAEGAAKEKTQTSRRLLFLAAHHGPALELGDRPVLLDPHDVADLELVL